MRHQGALADDREDASVGFFRSGNPPGGDRRPRTILQVLPVEGMELPQAGEIERGAVRGDVGRAEIEFPEQEFEHLFADAGLHLDTNGAAEAPATQLHLDRGQQVVGFLVLQGQVDVAGDPEDRVLLDDHPDEEAVQPGGDQLLGREKPNAVGQADQPREHVRHLDSGKPALAGVGVTDHRGEAESQVRDVRERVRRIDGERREHREDPLFEDVDRGTSCLRP